MPKRAAPLTDVQIKNAKPKEKSYKLADGGGLYLEVLPSGGKSWRMRYYLDGKAKKIVFGLWPDLSLKEARSRREDARNKVANGIDPCEHRKQTKIEAASQAEVEAATFEVVAREWHTKQVKVWSEGHAIKVMGRMEQHLFPAFGNVPITTLRSPVILSVLRKIEEQGKHESAKRLRQYCEAVFAFAIAEDKAERNVGADLRGALAPCKVKHRPAIVDPKEFGRLLRMIEGYEYGLIVAAAMKLIALTFVRPGEQRTVEWSEIDLEADGGPQWMIPAEKAKMRSPHIVPLSRQVVRILEDQHPLTGAGKYVFPCNRTNGRCMSNMTINAALRRLGIDQDVHAPTDSGPLQAPCCGKSAGLAS